MASVYRRLLDPRALTANLEQPRDEVFDAGAYNTLQVQIRALSSGGGAIALQHAAVNEADAWKDLSGGSQSLSGTGNFVFTISNFLRFVRWKTDASVSGNPVAIIDIVAKE